MQRLLWKRVDCSPPRIFCSSSRVKMFGFVQAWCEHTSIVVRREPSQKAKFSIYDSEVRTLDNKLFVRSQEQGLKASACLVHTSSWKASPSVRDISTYRLTAILLNSACLKIHLLTSFLQMILSISAVYTHSLVLIKWDLWRIILDIKCVHDISSSSWHPFLIALLHWCRRFCNVSFGLKAPCSLTQSAAQSLASLCQLNKRKTYNKTKSPEERMMDDGVTALFFWAVALSLNTRQHAHAYTFGI